MERNIKLLALFNFFTDLKFHSAFLILYFVKVTGSLALGMSIFSVIYIFSALFEVPTGIYSDLIGRRKTIILGAISATLSAVFYAIGFNYWWLFAGAILEGLSRSWYSGNNDAFLHDTLTQLGKRDYYEHYLGRVSSMFQFALMIGAVFGSILAYFSFAWVMWLSVIPQLICFIISTKMLNPTIQNKKDSGNIFSHLHFSALHLWKNRKLRLLSFNSIISFGIGESTFDFRAAFVKTLWPIWAIGFAKTLSFLGASLSFWYSGKILRKIEALKLKFYSNIYSKIVNIFSAAFPSIFSPAIMSSTSLFYGVGGVAESKLMQKEYTEEQRAILDSLNSLLGSLFYGIFAVFIGFIADAFGPAKALLIAQIISLPTVYINWKLVKMNKVK